MPDPEILNPGEEASITPVNVAEMDAYTRSSINMQIEFAQNHPRKMDLVLKELETLSCRNEEVAEAMFYTLKRKDKDGNTKLIQGPSVRFAEVLVYCWRNTRSDKGISNVDAEFVTGQGIMFDLERNNALKVETKRRITDKTGRRYNADMIQTTGNASSSLSYRNAITSVIPQALWMPILEKAKKVAVGGTASVNERRNAAIEYGKKVGISPEQIFSTLNVQGINDVGIDELVTLKGLFNAMKEGEMSVEEAFGDPYDREINALMDQLGWNQGRKTAQLANYRGRSVELIAYLRKQVEPLNGGQAKAEDKPKEQAVEEDKKEQAEPAKAKRGRPVTKDASSKDAPKEEDTKPTTDTATVTPAVKETGTTEEVSTSQESKSEVKAEEKVKTKPIEPDPSAGTFNF